MNLPSNIRLIDGGARLDGGTIHLHALDESGETFKIRLNQYMFGGTEEPGRLFFNDNIVGVRSECETLLLSILETAEIQIEVGPHPDTTPNYIGPPTDAIEAANEEKTSCIDEFRTLLIDFVRSDRYIEISKHGIQS